MNYIDLHCHPSTKPMLTLKVNRVNCWFNIRVRFDNIIENIFDSQSSLSQICQSSECNLVCIALHPLELSFAKSKKLQNVARFISYFDRDQLLNIAGQFNGYRANQLLIDELSNLKDKLENPYSTSSRMNKIQIIQSMDDYDQNDYETLHIILNVEGGHAFYYDKNEFENIDRIKENLNVFKNKEGDRLLYITLTHLAQNVFANHAFGMKFLGTNGFLPNGNGITEKGFAFIDHCLDTNNDQYWKILIDVKHMSLKSRKHYYQHILNGTPIICSHAGLTGKSWSNVEEMIELPSELGFEGFTRVVHKKKKGHIEGTYFNPCSINLYDEEIQKIVTSRGIIGINLDERILGASYTLFSDKFKLFEEEYFNPEEFNEEFRTKIQAFHLTLEEQESMLEEIEVNSDEEYLEGYPINSNHKWGTHLKFFVNTLIHIYLKGWPNEDRIEEDNPWKYVCIGSDFDGLINPVDTCVNITKFPEFALELERAIKFYSELLDIPSHHRNSLINDLLYNNAKRFLDTNFR